MKIESWNPVFATIAACLTCATLFLLATPYPAFAIVPSIAALFVLAMVRAPVWGFYFVVFLIPFGAYRSIDTPVGSIKIHWLVSIVVLGVVCAKIVVSKTGPGKALPSFGLWRKYAFFIVLCVVSALFSPFSNQLAKEIGLLLAAALFMAITVYFTDESVFRRGLPGTVVASAGIVASLAAVGFFFEIPFFAEKVGGAFKRGLGAAPDPNNLALMIVFSFPFLAYWFLESAGTAGKCVAALLFVANLAGMVSTYSRGGAIVLCFAIFLVLIVHRRRFWNPRTLGLFLSAFGVVAAIALILAPQSYWQRLASVTTASDLSLKRRTSYLGVAWDSFLQRPLIGWGLNAFPLIYKDSEAADRYVRKGKSKKRPAHNTYLEVLVGSGFAGFAAFAAVLAHSLLNFLRARKLFLSFGDESAVKLTETYLAAFLSLLVFLMMFSDVYHKYLLLSLGASEAIRGVAIDKEKENDAIL